MARSAKKMSVDIKELRAPERIFQIDRDTFLIYVGLQAESESPFVRVGSGNLIPESMLPHIGSVILPENNPINVAMEMEWLEASMSQGQEKVHYLGAKEQISQLQKLAKLRYSSKKNALAYSQEDDPKLPLETEVFGPPLRDLAKDKVTVNQMRDGNFVIFVGSTRVFDHSTVERGRIGLEREYALLEEALSKQACRLERADKRSFLWLGRENSINAKRPFLYWNLRNSGVLVNPCFNYHQALFEERIHSRRAKGFLSYSGEDSGFVEGIRHQDALRDSVAFFSANEELAPSFKKMYPNTKLLPFNDSDAVPFVPDTNFFASRSKSHAAFSWRFSPDSDQVTQLMFPLGGRRPRRAFDLIRAPHDVEVQVIDSRDDFKLSMAHISLQVPGDYPAHLFERKRLKRGAYPLVAHKEYVLHEGLNAKDLIGGILRSLQTIPQHEFLRSFLALHLGARLTPAILNSALRSLSKIKVPFKDFVTRHNLWSYFEFIKTFPLYDNYYTPAQKRSLQYICSKYSPLQTSYKKWLSLEKQPVEFHIFLWGGRRAFLFTRQIEPDPIAYKMPPPLPELAQHPRAYTRQLRLWERALDRNGDPGGFRYTLEVLDKIYEEKIRLLEEKKRFDAFVSSLGLTLSGFGLESAARKNMDAGLWAGLLQLRQNLANFKAIEKINFGGNLGDMMSPLLRVAPIGLLAALLLFGAMKTIGYLAGGISTLGDSASEIAATRLVAVGEVQSDGEVPGEDDIETSVSEISQYVNVLARNNGFRSLRANEIQAGANPRDIDLVFPGDRLRLPDRRITGIEKGEHVWEIARSHYRKDFARMQIMQRQIYALLSDKAPLRERRRGVRQKQALMRRLAVSTNMRAFLRETEQEVRRRLR